MNIVARKKEIEILKKISISKKAEFVVVYGRRRIGKTYLIKEFFNEQYSFYSTGVFSKKKTDQLSSFKSDLIKYGSTNKTKIKDWFDAFSRLEDLLENENIYRTNNNKRVIFIDELPWLDTPKSNFKVALERFWNTYASRKNDIILIVCGSATSWIIKNLLKSRGGFYNRITNTIHLSPFTLKECEQLSDYYNLGLSRQQLLDYYMVFGGVPLYLNLIDPSLSIAQNVDNLVFNKYGMLFNEYDMLLSSLFNNYEIHKNIIEELAIKKEGLTRNDLISNNKLKEGGGLSRALEELEQCGFIRGFVSYNKNKHGIVYQLVDHFTLFTCEFVGRKRIDSWINILETNEYNAWAGHAFELVAINSIESIKYTLGISGIKTNICAFRSKNDVKGAQIDLLIDRSDKIINLCECKYSKDEYPITKDDQSSIINKKRVFNEETKNRKDFIVTFITVNGVKNNSYRDAAQKVLDIDDLFTI